MLSQAEIDALLSAVSSEGSPEDSSAPAAQPQADDHIRPYDFRRPDHFSKEQMRALRMIHESLGRRAALTLSGFLRGTVEVGLADIDQGTYVSFNQQLGVRGIYYVIALGTLPGHFILFLSSDLAMAIVDRLMGGQGIALGVEREPTDLELNLLRVLTDRLLTDMAEAWAGTISLRPRVEDTSFNLMLVPIALPSDAMVWASFEVRMKGITSGMVLGLPYPALKPIAGQLRPYTWMSNTGTSLAEGADARREDMIKGLKEVHLLVKAILGTTPIHMAELSSLQKGDILSLNTPADGLCEVHVNGVPKYFGRPGLRGRRLCVRLEQAIDTTNGPPKKEPETLEEPEARSSDHGRRK